MKHKNNSISFGILVKGTLIALFLGVSLTSMSQIIRTFAGSYNGYSGDGGVATAAELSSPTGLTVDASGNIYIADEENYLIRQVNTSGIISTFAGIASGAIDGTNEGYSGDGGPATAAELNDPRDIAVDVSGNFYIVDENNERIRKVNTSGIISTFAGTGHAGYSGDGGAATAADLYLPTGIAVDAFGNVYIADYFNDRIRKVNTSGIISTFAGKGTTGSTGDGGQATSAKLDLPIDVALDASGNVYIADYSNKRIRKVNTSGIISTFAGNGSSGYSGNGGQATAAEFKNPVGVKIDASGNVYIADELNFVIRIVNTSGIINTFAGNDIESYSGDGGPATAAELGEPFGLAIDASSNVYVADQVDDRIREVTLGVSASVITNVQCNGQNTGSVSATAGGGRSPYTYSWSPGGAVTSTVTGLSAGTYTITVKDNASSTASAAVTITQPTLLTTGASVLSNACNSTNSANAMATPSGGGSPYTYSWSNGITSNPTGAVLSAGTYTVTVTDNCGSTATASVTIKQSTPITATTITSANVSCWGGSNGLAKAVSVSGGSSPYTYFWNPVPSGSYIASGLSAGTYTVTIVDRNGCNSTAAAIVTQPTAALRDSVAVIDYPQCGGETASATVGVKGGTSPYNYIWSPNISTTATATGLTIRGYAVQVKDNKGCYNNLNFSITQPPIPVLRDSIVRSATMNVLCNGGNNGSAIVGVKYGTAPYTYSWSAGGGNNGTATGLSMGTYVVTVNDAGGCTTTASVSIGEPSALSSTAFAGANVSCNGGSTGQAKVSVSGGSTPYTYSWSPATSSTYIASGLSVGTYTVTVSDNCGTSVTSSAVIAQPALLRDSVATIGYPLCTGGTGNATVGVTGGTSPYKYTWSPNVSSTNSATGLTVRSYEVQVKDNNGCYNNLNFSISQPAALRDSIVKSATVNISCNGSNSGSATVGVKYGTAPYTYTWIPAGGNSGTASGLSGGTYTVTVNDGGGCTVTASVTITQPGALSPTAFIGINISCNGGSNGQAKVSVSGGSIPYTYSWSPATGSTYIASGLSSGTYTVTVMDKCGASASSSVAVTQPATLSDSVVTSNTISPPCSGGGTGSATIGVTGGTSPYRYAWSPNVSTTATATGLTVRSYVVQVKDKNGCYNNVNLSVTCSDSSRSDATYKTSSATCCPLSDNINLYPNPNTGQFTLSGLQKDMILEMFDYTGKMISSMTTTNESMQLNIFNQADGVYLIRILDKDGNLIGEKKVVKTQ